jgi:hypothetical protein
VSWKADPGADGTADDPFTTTEEAVRGLTGSPWWQAATPPQRAEAITSRMLAGAGEWWLFGAWGRWYRSGLDGSWYPCQAPADPAARHVMGAAPPGAGRPPVPSPLIPTGPDLAAGRVAATGFVSGPPSNAVVARVQQALITALSVNPAQFALRDGAFAPGTPSTVAAAWGALLWCAGSPVAVSEHPLIELFAPYLTVPRGRLRWMAAPDLAQLAGYYCERLAAGDGVGAAHIVRVIAEIASALRTDPAFRPGAHALDAIAAATTQMIRFDLGGIRFGGAAVVDQWRRRCPAEFATAIVREAAPGEYLRLVLYDLEGTVRALYGGGKRAEPRHAAVALLAADLQDTPAAYAAILPWLDPDGARTLRAVTDDPDHPLRRLWPRDGRLPGSLRPSDRTGVGQLEVLLATSYALDLTWCRLAQTAPPTPGFTVPAAAAAELSGAAVRPPRGTGELTPWQIIEAARAHLASGLERPDASPEQTAADRGAAAALETAADQTPAPAEEPPAPPEDAPADGKSPAIAARPAMTEAMDPPVGPPVPGPPPPDAAALGVPHVVEAHGIRFLCGPDDVGRLLTELRRRGQWSKRLQGQEVSSASAPGLLLVGAASSGQRRAARMVSKTLAEVGVGSGEVHSVRADELRARGPDHTRAVLDDHAGHTLLLDGLDTLIFDEPDGAAFAQALYRARIEGVSRTTLVATCAPDRWGRLSAGHPELVTDLRVLRMPDLTDPAARVALLEVLAAERHLRLSPEAWEVARRDMGRIRGRGRLTGARLVEAYLDRATTRHLGQADDTQTAFSSGDEGDESDDDKVMTLGPGDVEEVAEELEPSLRDLRDVDTYVAELRSLAGLAPVKDAIEKVVAEARVAAARRRAGLPVTEGKRNLGFAGGPGTAKTTVARLVGKLFAVIGLLESGHVVECPAGDLPDADRTRGKVNEALGGVLLIDQAPALHDAAAGELTRLMDERGDEFIVICTGHPAELTGFLDDTPAVHIRLGDVIVFPDPTDADLVEIFRGFADRQRYVLDDDLQAELPARMTALRSAEDYAAGTSVRRFFDDTVACQSLRIVRDGDTLSADQLTRLTLADLPD